MNQDSQIFTDNQASLNDHYTHSKMSEAPDTTLPLPPPPAAATAVPTVEEKTSLNYAHPRFTMSTFQLYETKTVRKGIA